jgi:hypothetical protein
MGGSSYDNRDSQDGVGGGGGFSFHSMNNGSLSGGWHTVEPGVAHSFTQRNGMGALDGDGDSDFDEVCVYLYMCMCVAGTHAPLSLSLSFLAC